MFFLHVTFFRLAAFRIAAISLARALQIEVVHEGGLVSAASGEARATAQSAKSPKRKLLDQYRSELKLYKEKQSCMKDA